MSKQDIKDKFIELRINGNTFESIAKQLNVSKQTLINWSKEEEVQDTIIIADLMKYQSILKVYKLNREAKIEYYIDLTKKLREELNKRDLSELTTDKLFKLLIESEDRINGLLPYKKFGGDVLDMSPIFAPSFFFNPQN